MKGKWYKIMLEIILKMFIGLFTGLVNGSNHTEFHFYPFAVKLDRYVGSCNKTYHAIVNVNFMEENVIQINGEVMTNVDRTGKKTSYV